MIHGELTGVEIAKVFGSYQKNPSSFFGALKTGKISITVEQILKAQEHFGLNPCDLFNRNIEGIELDANSKVLQPELMEMLGILKSQQQTIHELVTQQSSKKGSM